MISRKKRSHVFTAFLAATLSSAVLLAAFPTTAAAQVGFDFGIFDNGAFGLRNTSIPSVTLNAFTVTFTAPNPTFFDTAPTGQGTSTSTGFNFFFNFNGGITSATLPSDAATDGQQTATFSFSGFDPGDVAGISFDLDSFNGGLVGSPTGGLVSALFSNGQTASGIIGASSFFVPDFDTFNRGVRVVSPDPVPEPGEYATAAAFLGTMGILMIRGRRIRARLVA